MRVISLLMPLNCLKRMPNTTRPSVMVIYAADMMQFLLVDILLLNYHDKVLSATSRKKIH